jgi:predicted DNA-binding transcriptional regulator YafY
MNFFGLFGLQSGFLEDINTQKFAKIQEALNLGMRVKLKYLSSSTAEVTEREVIPKEMKQQSKHHYLVGYCCMRQEERSFRVDNILSIELL